MTSQSQFARLNWGLSQLVGGWCAAAWTSQGLSAFVLPQKSKKDALRKLQEYLPPLPKNFLKKPTSKVPSQYQNEIRKALEGKDFSIPLLDLFFLTPFQQKILQATCQIPRGQCRTYGWVAQKAGSPRGFRAAGQALNRNPVSLFIPCHRVIASANQIGGYGGGLEWKLKLLALEGITVKQGFVKYPG